MPHRYLLIALLGIAAVSGGAAAAPRKASDTGAKVRFEGRQTESEGSITLRFSLETTKSSPPWLSAYLPGPDQPESTTPLQPIYRIELLRGGKWVNHALGWCGTGVGNVKMTPGTKRFFTVTIPPGEWDAMRAGVSLASTSGKKEESRVVWSEPVPRSILASKPKP